MNESTNEPALRPEKPGALTWCSGAIWLGAVVGATFLMMAYANTPGPAGDAPEHWPDSSQLSRGHSKPTLVMFVHPRCPCSRASVGELALLMAQCKGELEAKVCFIKPDGMAEDWTKADLWDVASRIPGVSVVCDEEGREARRFGARTSGETRLFDASGRLMFHGGITSARGHSGDNAGRDAVQALVLHIKLTAANTPVFGCSLFNCQTNETP